MPAGGMTIRLPQLIGINRARQMSLTGNFIDAPTACAWGLVNEVVAHRDLLDHTTSLAVAVGEVEPLAIRELRMMYESFAHRADDEAYREEVRWSGRWMQDRFDVSTLLERKDRIIGRGSAQQS